MYDLVIIGGGINGCGCAADAAMRGLSVLLCEQDDLASKTSSSSSKLIHGGLRYLEHYDLSLVKKSLNEQQKLIDLAPHLVHPLSFVLPYEHHGRPVWMLRTGLFLYDHLSLSNTLPNSHFIERPTAPLYFSPLTSELNKGFLFYDCKTDDARLTLANATQAARHGAIIKTNCALTEASTEDNVWRLTLQSKSGVPEYIQAKAVINAAGPWVPAVNHILGIAASHEITLVKGSHILTHKLYEGEHAYLLQHKDGRIVFVIPFHNHTLIGTTESLYTDALDSIHIDTEEIDYLAELVSLYFIKSFNKSDIITTWSGVRPLLSEKSSSPTNLSRDYTYQSSTHPAPAVTIYGGKLTTYRQLALEVIDQFEPIFPSLGLSSSDSMPLPGATFDAMNFKDYKSYAREKYHWLEDGLLDHYLKTYGTLTENILKNCMEPRDLGVAFSPLLFQVEVDYLVQEEWATTSTDILWRRTKLGLSMSAEREKALSDYLKTLRSPNV